MQRNKDTEQVAPNALIAQLSRRKMLSTMPATFWLGAVIQAKATPPQRGATRQQTAGCPDFNEAITPQMIKNLQDGCLVNKDMATIQKLAMNTNLGQMGVK